MIAGTGHSLPPGIAPWTQGAGGNDYLTSLTPVQQPGGGTSGSYSDIVIGYLEPLLSDNSACPFAAGTHFMLVNGATTGTAAQKAQWYHLTFDFGSSGYDSLQRLSRDTGLVETVSLTHLTGSQYALDWNLEGGTGELFRFWSTRAAAFLFPPRFDASGNIVISGTNVTGVAGGTYSVVSSSDLTVPPSEWQTNATGVFGAGGAFTNIIPGASVRELFFRIN